MGTVSVGSGMMWENPTLSIPIVNLKHEQVTNNALGDEVIVWGLIDHTNNAFC